MLPYPKHMPSTCLQSAGHQPVTILVAEQLLFPECPVSRGLGCVFQATMPKAPVHKYCKAMLQKDKIWIAEQLGVATPTDDAMLPEKLR